MRSAKRLRSGTHGFLSFDLDSGAMAWLPGTVSPAPARSGHGLDDDLLSAAHDLRQYERQGIVGGRCVLWSPFRRFLTILTFGIAMSFELLGRFAARRPALVAGALFGFLPALELFVHGAVSAASDSERQHRLLHPGGVE